MYLSPKSQSHTIPKLEQMVQLQSILHPITILKNADATSRIYSDLFLGEMYAHCFDLCVVIQSICSQFSAQARLLEPTEWHLVVKCVVVVDPYSSDTS